MMENSNKFITFRPNKRILLVSFFISASLIVTFFTTFLSNNSCTRGRLFKVNKALAFSSPQQQYYQRAQQQRYSKFVDLNHLKSSANAQNQQVLILTPLKNAAKYLPRYFELIDRLTYPKHLINIAFLVSDTTDDTINLIQQHLGSQYNSVTVYEKDFGFELPEDKRHTYQVQPLRRSLMARSRNYLLAAALKDRHAWVLWLDVDVVQYPEGIIEDLQSVDVDIVVPNCLKETEDGSFWGYDKNNWQETNESRRIQETLDPDYVLLEGYKEFETKRYSMVDMPTHGDRLQTVPLDGVGATFTLVKAHVHREGANFPPYVYQHQVETEGFAKIAKTMGYGVYGLPAYLIYHISNS